jgi:hypothetical protein
MYEYHVVVRAIMDERMRDAEHYRVNAGRRRRKRTSTARGGPQGPPLHSRLWYLAHFRRAYT